MEYISIKQVMDDLLDNPLMLDINFERVVRYTIDFIRKVGMPKEFEDKIAEVEIEDNRGLLPCDLYQIVLVKAGKQFLRETTSTFKDTANKDYDPVYSIKGRIIYTSIKDGLIEVAYRAIPVDDDGYPMIVDNASFVEALELYIQKKHLFPKVAQGVLHPSVYGQLEQQYAWAVGLAQTSLVMPTIDLMQNFTNMWNSLIPRVSEHSRGFRTEGTKLLIIKH